ncbi:MAG: L-threonylcarbamoyladenylate synthase [Candidatus Marsarchaeota archaeon]|nr:L-threonylcarbamoyladenylate synthase [Candidatus Marsarchaeota archaeon]MCL5106409.1 L-threonylcarbamoyladenylate synthase [Candidatus Marsarchaeota archaeon]
MEEITIDLDAPSKAGLEYMAGAIKQGKVIAIPTDTVYGLATSIKSDTSIKKIFEIKQRDERKAIPVLVNSVDMAKSIAKISKSEMEIVEKVWPGPISILFVKRKKISDVLTSGKDTIMLRIPDDKFLNILLKLIDEPITATSANISGEKSFTTAEDLIARFAKEKCQPDIVVKVISYAQKQHKNKPSTLITIIGKGQDTTISVLREGCVSEEQLLHILNKKG